MRDDIQFHYDAEMARYRAHLSDGDGKTAWVALERAHILSQAFAGPHTRVHWEMFKLGLSQGHWQEVLGQIPRLLLAAPGSLLGKAPRGNTGRSTVGIFAPMPIPDDLQRILKDA
ncbi:hypothetical protein D3C72_1936110 [compost metagenome]